MIDLEKLTTQNAASMRKGLIEYSVMLICSCDPVYVGEIVAQLKEAEMIVVEGTLYPLLSRLAKEELVSYKWQESDSGPPRKYYELTQNGQQVLNAYTKQWTGLKKAIDKLNSGVKK